MTVADKDAPRSHHERVHDEATLAALASFFKRLNSQMVLMWRLGLGRWAEAWPSGAGRILVLQHRGRKSGRPYRTPLNFTRDGESLYCVAGFGKGSDWFLNVSAAGSATVYLPNGAFEATVTDASDSHRRVVLIRSVLKDAGFASYLAGIDPRTMSDDELSAATETYRLVRFDPIAPSAERIDDLRWVWLPIAVGTLVAWRVLRRLTAR